MTGNVKNVGGPLTQTETTNTADMSRQFAPGWGVTPHADESLDQVIRREKQGRRKTPIGPGTLVPRRQ